MIKKKRIDLLQCGVTLGVWTPVDALGVCRTIPHKYSCITHSMCCFVYDMFLHVVTTGSVGANKDIIISVSTVR